MICGIRPAVGLLACALIGVALVEGCALFSPADVSSSVEAHRPLLPPLRPPTSAIQIQVMFVDRPLDDTLLSQLLWQQVDQVGAVPPAQRLVLKDNGLRVAQSGASVPPALQSLLGLKSETTAHPSNEDNLSGRQFSLQSGQDSEVLVSGPTESCAIRYRLPGSDEVIDFPQARRLLRIRPVRLQDGWVRLEFTPEVHHGVARMRHSPGEEGWTLRGGQKVDVREPLRFQVTLNTGELAIVGLADAATDTLGQQFFRYEQDGREHQRLLVVRLADAGRAPSANPAQP